MSPGQYGGLLGRAYEPLQVGDVRDGAAELRGLEPESDLPAFARPAAARCCTALEDCSRDPGEGPRRAGP